mmetsp:Transcript_56314/g.168590  ORF Transcript_56314/g.168590 Transcript_56314/m.168590 type:complete len:89 (-) Transcript_56314:309-575(-)
MASNNSGVDNFGLLYATLWLIGGNCISLTLLSNNIEEARGLERKGLAWHALYACFDPCTCHSCRVVAECKVLEKENGGAPASQKVDRK